VAGLTERWTARTGYGLAAVFAAVGLVFLFMPGRVVDFFNRLSGPLGMPAAQVPEAGFFNVLAAAYMAVVTALAWNMGARPKSALFPRLLALAKFSSAILSLGYFLVGPGHLLLLANGVVDGLIGAFALWASVAAAGRARGGEPAA